MKQLQYVWDYYKIWIIGAAVCLGLAGYFGSLFLQRPADVLLDVAWVNFYDDVSAESKFSQEFYTYADMDAVDSVDPADPADPADPVDSAVSVDSAGLAGQVESGSFVFDSNYFFDMRTMRGSANSYAQKLIAGLEAKTVDAVICQADNLTGIGESGRFLDLRDERLQGIYEKYRKRIVTVEKDGQTVPVGIDISDSRRFEAMNGYADACYLAVSSQVQHPQMVILFLEYLLEG